MRPTGLMPHRNLPLPLSDLSRRINLRMAMLGINRSRLAALTGINLMRVGCIVAGKKLPNLIELFGLAEALLIQPDKLIADIPFDKIGPQQIAACVRLEDSLEQLAQIDLQSFTQP